MGSRERPVNESVKIKFLSVLSPLLPSRCFCRQTYVQRRFEREANPNFGPLIQP